MALLRIDKYLADAGIGTRSEIKTYIKKGFVQVNDSTVKKPDIKVDPDTDIIQFQNKTIRISSYEYYILNKPKGYVSATKDNTAPTVLSLIKEGRKDLFPVGRLDKDTEGLLLITNDGELSHKLLSPKKHVDKTYYAAIEGIVNEDDIKAFQNGLEIGDEDLKVALPAKLTILSTDTEKNLSYIEVTLQEGKFHQVKRMFQAVGKKVTYLKRISFGSLTLPEDLKLGEYRALTDDELATLKHEQNHFRIGFIGLGLIGGSIAKSIRRVFPDSEILGFDVDKKSLSLAKEDKTLTDIVTSIEAMKDCDYIFLCAPVHYNIEYLPILKKIMKPACILTDVGSVKSDIYSAIHDNQLDDYFIGGHPMVGSERSGYDAATDRLIENAYYFVTPSATVEEKKVENYRTFLEDLGAIPIIYSPERHDEITAYISHIPHIIASSLVNLVASKEDENGMLKQLAAGGFKDITRIASSNPVVWEHILLSNPQNITEGLRTFIKELEGMISAIEADNAKDIYSFFDSAKEYRNSVPDHATGVIRMNYDVYVDIPDEANALAKAITLIGEAGINLKNLGITHNREDNEGVLRLSFYDNEAATKAAALLKNHNYQVYER